MLKPGQEQGLPLEQDGPWNVQDKGAWEYSGPKELRNSQHKGPMNIQEQRSLGIFRNKGA
jgi:hypothetical protein